MIVPYFPLVVTLAVGAGSITAVFWWRWHRGALHAVPIWVDASMVEVARRAIHGIRARVVVSVVTGLVVGVAVAIPLGFWSASDSGIGGPLLELQSGVPPVFGFQQALAPVAGAAAMALVIVALPSTIRESHPPVKTANLSVRRMDAPSRSLGIVFAASVFALMLLLIATGVTASRTVTYSSAFIARNADTTNEGPYPGWPYGVPIIVGALVLCVLVVIALVRIHRAPGLGLVELSDLDEQIRGACARVVILTDIAAVALSIGIVLWGAGSTTAAVSPFPIIGDCHALDAHSQMCHDLGPTFSQPTFAIGITQIAIGAALVAASFALVVFTARPPRLSVRVLEHDQAAAT